MGKNELLVDVSGEYDYFAVAPAGQDS